VRWTALAGAFILGLVALLVYVVGRVEADLKSGGKPQRMVISVFDMTTGDSLQFDLLEYQTGYALDPDTGFRINPVNKHLLAPAVKCARCGQIVPPPHLSLKLSNQEFEERQRQYRCYLCGGQVYAASDASASPHSP
jgi:hypothetical protein